MLGRGRRGGGSEGGTRAGVPGGYVLRLLVLVLAGATPVRAQLDPVRRQLAQVGYNQPLEGRGPIAAYGFYYRNEPAFRRDDLTLRLALAPVYLDAELGLRDALGAGTDVGVGVAGGGFADSYSELRGGKLRRRESFVGHGAGATLSLYRRLTSAGRIPLHGILRAGARSAFYADGRETADDFVLPDDRATFTLRTGLRWGGQEPLLLPEVALEASAWYEAQLRTPGGRYGFAGDREVETASHLLWVRALFAYTFPRSRHYCALGLSAGTSVDADRFSAHRLGAVLPLVSEFPLTLPGYYYQEISARSFALASALYSLPLDAARRWDVLAYGASALVDYAPGLRQPGHWNSGVGGGITYRSPSGAWLVFLGYGYGIDAIRHDERGANSVALLLQYDFEARKRGAPSSFRPAVSPDTSRALDRALGRD